MRACTLALALALGCGERAPAPTRPEPPPEPAAVEADAAPPVTVSDEACGEWKPLGDPKTDEQLCDEARAEDENIGDCSVEIDVGKGVATLTMEALEQTMRALYLRRDDGKLYALDYGTYSSGRGYSECIGSIRVERRGARTIVWITELRSDDMRDNDGDGYEDEPVEHVCVIDGERARCAGDQGTRAALEACAASPPTLILPRSGGG